MGISVSQVEGQLADELVDYCNQEEVFRTPACIEADPLEWWKSKPDVGLLRKIALRIVGLRPSSANVERVFSLLKRIQAPSRTRLSLDSLLDIARVRLADYDDSIVEERDSLWSLSDIFFELSIDGEMIRGSRRRRHERRYLVTVIGSSPNRQTGMDSEEDYDPCVDAGPSRSDKGPRYSSLAMRKNHQTFSRLIDFNMISTINEDTQEVIINEPDEIVCARAVRKFRENLYGKNPQLRNKGYR